MRTDFFWRQPAARGSDTTRLAADFSASIRIPRGGREFAQLYEWKDNILAAYEWGEPIVGSGIDQIANRLSFIVSSEGSFVALQQAISLLNVPDAAVSVKRGAAPTLEASLTDDFDPFPAAVEVEVYGNGKCTAGPVIEYSDDGSNWYTGVFTAAHCATYFDTASDFLYQAFDGNYAGDAFRAPEKVNGTAYDPGGNCDTYDCYLVDAQLFDVYGVDATVGAIARPSSGTTWNGTDLYKVYQVNAGYVYANDPLTKIGNTTGLRVGIIIDTCWDAWSTKAGGLLKCQILVGKSASWMPALSGPGDSGAPWMSHYGGYDVTLQGVHWASYSDGDSAVVSPSRYLLDSPGLSPNYTDYTYY